MNRYLRIFRDYGYGILKFWIAAKVITPVTRFLGLYVISDHFYHPIPERKYLIANRSVERSLWSIDWKKGEQTDLLNDLLDNHHKEFNVKSIIGKYGYADEEFSISSGDAEILYAMVRHKKPRRIVEIGAGGSTRIILAALDKNIEETGCISQLITIDPSPLPFLDDIAVQHDVQVRLEVKRGLVQDTQLDIFKSLEENDILFVDSSHVFRQGSDVEHEFLNIYPVLQSGVIIHVHDIFFPFDYPLAWNTREYRFWNEQYFLEILLQSSERFLVVLCLSMMANLHRGEFIAKIGTFTEKSSPGSFWMRRA